jgi:hypothetical protein
MAALGQGEAVFGHGFGFVAQGAERVVPVAGMGDRQQVAVLGVEHEQEAEQQDQRGGLDRLAPRGVRGAGLRIGGGEGGHQAREDPVEHRF